MAKVMYILSGPTFDPDASLSARFELLSKNHSGVVITTSSSVEQKKYGTFMVRFSLFEPKSKLRSICRHFFLALSEAREAKSRGDGYELIISYDPLKTGLIAWLVSWIVRTKFITEVNGVYQSPFEWVDEGPLWGAIKRHLYMLVESFVLWRADGVKLLFPRQLAGLCGVSRNKPVRSFFNYVDTQRFSPGPDQKYILFVGFPYFRKGVDVLLEAYLRVVGDCPGWRLKIIGWLQKDDIARIEEFRRRAPSIEYSPPILHAEMPDRISKCSFLVLPSRSEAMGRVLVEAMACGKPRIGSNVDGIPTVISDGHDGFLFESEDVAALASKMRTLMLDEEVRVRLGTNAHDRHQREFSAEKYLEHLNELFFSVLHRAD